MTQTPHFTERLRTVSDRDLPRLDAHFLQPSRDFDASTLGEHLLYPREMAWFYGEPIWHQVSHEQRLMLNRLTFCQSYYTTAVAEAATNVLNYESVLRTMLRGDDDVAMYMAREVVEETAHIEAFVGVIRKLLAHYGLTLDDLRTANVSLEMATWYTMGHSVLGWARRNLDYYYFTRFALNVNQKTVERCAIGEPAMHPLVGSMLRHHAADEARHMQMSRATGIAALGRMKSRAARTAACWSFAHFAASLFIGRHPRDSRLTRETRVRTLVLCGVERGRAERAYDDWRGRVHQPLDPPTVRAGRRYYWRQMCSYIEALDVSPRLAARMKAIIGEAYADARDPAPSSEDERQVLATLEEAGA